MATGKRDQVAAATEAPTGLNHVRFANRTENLVSVDESIPYKKPLFLQKKPESRSKIIIYGKGFDKLKTFEKIVVSQLVHTDFERVARTAVMDGESRRYMGRAPRSLTFDAVFYNTVNEPWRDQFMLLWDEWLRGSKLQERDAYIYMYVDGVVYIGRFSGYQYMQEGSNDTIVVGKIGMDVNDVINLQIPHENIQWEAQKLRTEFFTNGMDVKKVK